MLAEVPSDYQHRIIDEDNVIIGTFKDKDLAHKKHFEQLPKGNWQLIGLSDEITERELADIMPSALGSYLDFIADMWLFDTALESFKSLMQSLGCEVNPYGVTAKPIKKDLSGEFDDNGWLSRWQEAQSKVGRYAVLKEIK